VGAIARQGLPGPGGILGEGPGGGDERDVAFTAEVRYEATVLNEWL
jgi:hypothetical protein